MNICIGITFLSKLMVSFASITGVTYMDNFDFDQRYENINECNPLYWLPLHLPDHCTKLFVTALQTGLKSNVPIRLVKEQSSDIIEISYPYGISSAHGAEVFQAPIRREISYYGHPFGKMLELLSRDVKDQPRAPTVGFMPNVGLVALYQQPISRKSEQFIKKVASMYTPDESYSDVPNSPSFMNTQWANDKTWLSKDISKLNRKSKGRPMVIKKKIKKGSALAIMKKTIY